MNTFNMLGAMSEVSAREMSQRFMQFVMMQAQNIMYVLGRVEGPNGNAVPPNLRAAKLLIDQLEMVEAKTKGNLSQHEASMLANVLSEVRLAFVEVSGGISPGMIPGESRPVGVGEEDGEDEGHLDRGVGDGVGRASGEQQEREGKTVDSGEIQSKRKFFKSYG